MPELPEVETVRRTLEAYVLGQTISTVTVLETRLRVPVDAKALERALLGRQIIRVRRRAKYLLLDMTDGHVLLMHLGMSGRLGVVAKAKPLKNHDHVVLRFENDAELRFNDPRRFGMVAAFHTKHESEHPSLVNLGIEPLSSEFDGAYLFDLSRGVQKPIKNFLMDGAKIVGVGNIYACESLFAAGIHPELAAGRVSRSRCERLVEQIKLILTAAIEQGGTTLRDFVNVEGDAGYFAVRLQVYGREGEACGACGHKIKRLVQAGRSTFFCSRCQLRK